MKELSKAERILSLYDELMDGRPVNRAEWAAAHGVCERSVRRDLDEIRRHLDRKGAGDRQKTYILYDRKNGCHRAEHLEAAGFSMEEFGRLEAALEESRSLTGEERRRFLRRIYFSALSWKEREACPGKTAAMAEEDE